MFAIYCLISASFLAAPAETLPTAEAVRFFENKVRPVLAENCYKCHGDSKQKSGLRLDSREAVILGGNQGTAIEPGRPENSLLIKAIRHEGELKMPPSKKLTPQQISDLTTWVKMGAPWPAADAKATEGPHWAFQPVQRPAVPAVKNHAWNANPIDAFILAKLEAKGLQPNPPANKYELVRRVCYDLTGLPPSLAEADAFVNNPSPRAWEDLIDRLLDSPRYGEKWGRHWLDLVRYAETNSYERDNPKPNAWRYRDYVIRAFNEDKPYDRFLREQLAGDELPDGGIDGIIATGFYRLGIWDDEPVDRDQARYDSLDDIVTTTGQVFLGLTVDCARCHNHKREPIPQKDYYRLLAFFRNISEFHNGGPTDEVAIFSDPSARLAYEIQVQELERRRRDAQEAVTQFERDFRQLYEGEENRTGAFNNPAEFAKLINSEGPRVLGKERFAQYRELRRKFEELRRQKTPGELALCVTERNNNAPDTFLLRRGNPHDPGDKVTPGFPQIFNVPDPAIPTPPPNAKTSGRRTVLANWLASADNPLTARVMVNRIWQHHFGRGIVRSSNDFGTKGDAPTHPELLDWLTSEFVARGWQLKTLHRLILTSNAYRMSSRGNPAGLQTDPTNDLFWRFDMRRLTAEEIRDSILAVNGTLSLKMYGPGAYVEIPPEVLAGQSMPGHGWGKSPPEEQVRRSIYIHIKRSLLPPIIADFDPPETDRTTPVRFATTQPTQALILLNGRFLNRQAAIFAERLRREAGDKAEARVRLALRLAHARLPSDAEVRRGVELMAKLQLEDGVTPDAALQYFCLMVLNLNEFIYLD